VALNVKIQVYRGTLSDLSSLATTGFPGVMAWTTDSKEMYVDSGAGSPGIGPGNAWQRLSAGNQLWTGQPSTSLSSFINAQVGDLAIASDNDTTYLLTAYPPTNNGNWVSIAASSSAVSSVNGQTGTVTLTLDDIYDGTYYARMLAAVLTDGEFDLAKSHQFGFTNDNLIQPSQMGTWAATTAFTLGQTIIDSNQNVQQVVNSYTPGTPASPAPAISAGISGGAVPTWSVTKGHTTADGTLVWENIGTALRVSVLWLGAPTAHEWVSYIDNSGLQHLSQPSFSDIAGVLSQTQLPASIGAGSNLTDIDCGTF
jgi:hypothetical protein